MQKRFPELRQDFTSLSDSKLWEQNIDVKIVGKNHERVQFIASTFANNASVKSYHTELEPVLRKLRFKFVDYKWYKYDSDYNTFRILSNPDKCLNSLGFN